MQHAESGGELRSRRAWKDVDEGGEAREGGVVDGVGTPRLRAEVRDLRRRVAKRRQPEQPEAHRHCAQLRPG